MEIDEKAEKAGMILWDIQKRRILLIQNRWTGKWGFPKGHMETFDIDHLENAMREVKEETGYLEMIHYVITSGPLILNGHYYWTANLRTDERPTLNREEHSGIGWYTPKELRGLQLHSDVKAWLYPIV